MLFKYSRRYFRKFLAIFTWLLITYFHVCNAGAVQINEYPLPNANCGPIGITSGPDGALWFNEYYCNKIGRIDPATHIITEYPIPTPNSGVALGITSGSDGAIWFLEGGTGDSANGADQVGRLDLITHHITEYPLTKGSGPALITSGPDGALWFTEQFTNRIGRFVPSNPADIEYISTYEDPWSITIGPDNAIWFNECEPNNLVRIDPITHVITSRSPVAGICGGLTSGPIGSIWFNAYHNAQQPMIGRFDLSTKAVSEYPVPTLNSNPDNITRGPDGAIWFAEFNASKIGRIDPISYQFEEYPTPTANSGPITIVSGPDGALWFTEAFANKIGRLSLDEFFVRLMEGTKLVETFASLQDAFNAGKINGEIIQAMKKDFSEVLTYSGSASIVLKGGYDSSFTNNPDFTTVNGSLTIGTGTVTVDNLILE